MREQQINQLYLREFFGSILLYLIILFPVTWIAKDMPDSMTRTLLALTPMLPALGMLRAILRHFKRMDEYLRIWNLESIALAGALTAVFSLTYGFLERVGFLRLSMFVIWCVFMGGWGIIACVRKSMEK